MSEPASQSYSTDPALYLYTSLTSGSSHIVTATSRMETILKANRIPFKAIDIATDEKARMIWGRRAGKDESGRVRKIPGLVQMGLVIGDLVEIEDWNEYGELKQHVTIYHEKVPAGQSAAAGPSTSLSKTSTPIDYTKTGPPAAPGPSASLSKASIPQENKKPEPPSSAAAPKMVEEKADMPTVSPITLALRQVGEEAAQKAKDGKKAAMQTYSGVGKAKPEKEEKTIPPAISLTAKSTAETAESIQSPNSTAWKKGPDGLSIEAMQALQSPTSSTWKALDVDGPITTHRGSTVSQASAEEIKKIEEDQAIPEEDEEDEEEEDDEEEEEDDEEDEEEEEEEDDDEDEDESEEDSEEEKDDKKATKKA